MRDEVSVRDIVSNRSVSEPSSGNYIYYFLCFSISLEEVTLLAPALHVKEGDGWQGAVTAFLGQAGW